MPFVPEALGFWRRFERISDITLRSGLAGIIAGAISGTIVPVFGTFAGAISGLFVGVALSPVVVPLLFRRNLGKAFGKMITVSALTAAGWLVFAWACLLSGFDTVVAIVYPYIAIPSTILCYLGTVWWAHTRLPRAWPPTRAGACAHCGYSLAGLRDWICPECGHDNEPRRLAQPGIK